jgi:hypothetical protein
MIRIPNISGWKILVQPQFLDEILRAPDDVLSFHEATADVSRALLSSICARVTYAHL